MISAGHLVQPDNTHQVSICIAGNTDVQTIQGGDWQCIEGNVHNYIGLGISFIYDSIDQSTPGNFSQESSITKLTTDGLAPSGSNESIQISSGVDDTSLLIGIGVNLQVGGNLIADPLTGDAGYINHYPGEVFQVHGESYNSEMNNGFSNFQLWNPRLVGANIWVTKFADDLDEPVLLGTINFYGDSAKYGLSKSHDGSSSPEWAKSDDLHYQSFLVESVPIMDYLSHTGYDVNEQHQVWYKTSAIVNRKLYVGNVAYFSSPDPLKINDGEPIEKHPDKILMSVAPNKFDIHPVGLGLELAKFDGQDIICLKNFNNELLIFKTNDFYTVDCSGEDEILKNTFVGKGIHTANHVVISDILVYILNSSGLYAYDGNTITDLVVNKVSSELWKSKIYNNDSVLSYDNEYNLILISTRYNIALDSLETSTKNLLIYNINNNALYFKDQLATESIAKFSKGINVESQLYNLSSSLVTGGSFTELTFTANTTTSYVPGTAGWFAWRFKLTDVGTFGGAAGGSCQKGAFNNKCKYIKALKENASGSSGDSWILMNANSITPPDNSNTDDSTQDGIDSNYKTTKEYLLSFLQSGIHSDYTLNNVYVNYVGTENQSMQIKFNAKYTGVQYNLAANGRDLDALGDPYDDFTYSSNILQEFGFSTTTTQGTGLATDGGSDDINSILQADGLSGAAAPNLGEATAGNGNLASMSSKLPGTDGTSSVHVLTPDVGSGASIVANTKFVIFANLIPSNGIGIDLIAEYVVGVNYWENDDHYTYVNEATLSGQSTVNTGIVDNIYQALIDDKLETNYNFRQIFNITKSTTAITFTSNPNSTILNGVSGYSISDINFSNTHIIDSTVLFEVGQLLYWVNDLPKNSGGLSILSSNDFHYETKDIDFGEPNVRKKIYKAYITYTGGNGEIGCFYQADQSGTWTAATVYDSSGSAATSAGLLNSSTTQTRAELKFGTGGNNKYSFALKFSGGSNSDSFEINDITIIYRLKRPK